MEFNKYYEILLKKFKILVDDSDSDDGVDSDDIEEIFSDYEDLETESDSDSDCELIWSDSN